MPNPIGTIVALYRVLVDAQEVRDTGVVLPADIDRMRALGTHPPGPFRYTVPPEGWPLGIEYRVSVPDENAARKEVLEAVLATAAPGLPAGRRTTLADAAAYVSTLPVVPSVYIVASVLIDRTSFFDLTNINHVGGGDDILSIRTTQARLAAHILQLLTT
jgi:hypothetical protein